MFSHLAKALAQLGDPRIRGVLVKGVIGSGVVILLLMNGMGWLVSHLASTPFSWINGFVSHLGWVISFALSMALFPAIVTFVVGFFLEDVIRAVELKHYPELGAPRIPSFSEVLVITGRYLLMIVGMNLLALFFLWIPGINLVIFFLVNGYLLGREYFELVALRRLDDDGMTRLWRSNRAALLGCGVMIAFLMTVPVLNIVAPVVAAAFMVHFFEHLRQQHSVG